MKVNTTLRGIFMRQAVPGHCLIVTWTIFLN